MSVTYYHQHMDFPWSVNGQHDEWWLLVNINGLYDVQQWLRCFGTVWCERLGGRQFIALCSEFGRIKCCHNVAYRRYSTIKYTHITQTWHKLLNNSFISLGQFANQFLFDIFQITQLKIDHNPFAKGFRDTGSGRREKKWVIFFHQIELS